MVQRPNASSPSFCTTMVEQDVGPRYGWSWRDTPLGAWDLTYSSITEAEAAVLEGFFASMDGRYGDFTFLDPNGNLLQYSEDFTVSAWEKDDTTPGAAVADPFGGAAATAVAGGSNGMLVASVLPGGNGSGLVLCVSAWVNPSAAGPLSIGMIDAGFAVIGSTSFDLPAGQWTRIYHSMTLATNSAIRVLIGGFASWAGRTIAVFGAQAAPTPGPGAYRKSPLNYGLHAKCRFDQDRIDIRHIGPGECSTQLRIVETN